MHAHAHTTHVIPLLTPPSCLSSLLLIAASSLQIPIHLDKNPEIRKKNNPILYYLQQDSCPLSIIKTTNIYLFIYIKQLYTPSIFPISVCGGLLLFLCLVGGLPAVSMSVKTAWTTRGFIWGCDCTTTTGPPHVNFLNSCDYTCPSLTKPLTWGVSQWDALCRRLLPQVICPTVGIWAFEGLYYILVFLKHNQCHTFIWMYFCHIISRNVLHIPFSERSLTSKIIGSSIFANLARGSPTLPGGGTGLIALGFRNKKIGHGTLQPTFHPSSMAQTPTKKKPPIPKTVWSELKTTPAQYSDIFDLSQQHLVKQSRKVNSGLFLCKNKGSAKRLIELTYALALKTMDIHRYLQNYCTVDTSAMGEYHLIFSKGFYCPCDGFCGIFGFGNIQEILDSFEKNHQPLALNCYTRKVDFTCNSLQQFAAAPTRMRSVAFTEILIIYTCTPFLVILYQLYKNNPLSSFWGCFIFLMIGFQISREATPAAAPALFRTHQHMHFYVNHHQTFFLGRGAIVYILNIFGLKHFSFLCPVVLKPPGNMCKGCPLSKLRIPPDKRGMTPHPAIYILRQEHPLTRPRTFLLSKNRP
ncbi:putative signal peptide protein [Puccinia sorghi]|uniref:Putative signal peptide protein n=1 Tax=Puccinia sorghi TaxID=27349 RepID=A0A0L6VGW9_9BASI|nr:putative signal peptide protein [Puccinia sorghi]